MATYQITAGGRKITIIDTVNPGEDEDVVKHSDTVLTDTIIEDLSGAIWPTTPGGGIFIVKRGDYEVVSE